MVILSDKQGYCKNVINMHTEDDHASQETIDIHTPLTAQMCEPLFHNSPIKGFVPHPACLLHSVNALQELPNPVFFPHCCKAGWLLHEHSLIQQKTAMEEHHFDVELVDVSVESGSDVGNCVERFQLRHWGGCLIVVNSVMLHKTLSNIADYIQ